MNKYVFLTTTLLGIFCGLQPARADLPFYEDDAEFKKCAQATGNLNECARKEVLRTLEKVKLDYRAVLTNPAVLEWHAKLEENTEILHDMYESWTAFRNRMCLLSYTSSAYLEPTVDERYSCNLYYTMHHKAQLDSVLQLMEKKVPAQRKDFHFLDITEHDKKYQACLQREAEDICFEEELKRSSDAVKDLYKTFITDVYVGKWNNGPNLQQGNYRDMYDSWLAYRNRFCQLATWAFEHAYGEQAPQLGQCLLILNLEKAEAMRNLYMAAHSLQKKNIEDFDEKVKELKKAAPTRDTDGGEEVGKSIPPLQQPIASGGDEQEEELVPTYQQPTAPQPEKSNKEIPAWAKQK